MRRHEMLRVRNKAMSARGDAWDRRRDVMKGNEATGE